jgi:biopolymer transport protein ExbB
MESLSLYSVLVKGGWVMLPIALCSLVGAAIIVERLVWGLKKARVIPRRLVEDVIVLIHAGKIDQAQSLCTRDNCAMGRLIGSALENAERPHDQLVEYVEIAGRRESQELQRFVGTLGIIAAVSPLLGLLGTVFGMIETFGLIGRDGVGNAQGLAGGIAEALITTASGLTVAIPCLVFYRLFVYQARALAIEMERISLRVVDALCKLQQSNGQSAAANS